MAQYTQTLLVKSVVALRMRAQCRQLKAYKTDLADQMHKRYLQSKAVNALVSHRNASRTKNALYRAALEAHQREAVKPALV